ncbi:hypothetical protein FACS1894196_2480 [Clostridia bacterium]|nr:hypothetical protein FACS1894196_2480 [Clostridia bacterium]
MEYDGEQSVYTRAGETEENMDLYIVQPGDTYADIAEKLETSAETLGALNPDLPEEIAAAGYPLHFPARGDDAGARPASAKPMPPPAVTPPAPPPVVTPPAPACPPNHQTITVPGGWDWGHILLRYTISYDALCRANPGVNLDALCAGQALCIPPSGCRGLCEEAGMFTHIIERSDSLASLARRFRVTEARILRANPHLAPCDFVAGRVICVPGSSKN